jgi:hypothetical protein
MYNINKEDEKDLYEIWEDEINKDLTGLSFKEWIRITQPNIGEYSFQ